MSNEQKVQVNTLGGFVRAISGFFITQSNPHGLSPKEVVVTSLLLALVGDRAIDANDKVELADRLNQPVQITRNYINSLKRKGVITKDNKFHPFFFKQRIIIEKNGEDTL